jgi:hypothetical protein
MSYDFGKHSPYLLDGVSHGPYARRMGCSREAALLLLLGMLTPACSNSASGDGGDAGDGGVNDAGDGGGSDAGDGGRTPIGACDSAGRTREFDSCSSTQACQCPLGCVDDWAFDGSVCEQPCVVSSDCENLGTVCAGGFCGLNVCAQTPAGARAPGAYNAPCDVDATGDGTCLPTAALLPDGGLGASWGVCLQSGPGGSCESSLVRHPWAPTDYNSLCPQGSLCLTRSCWPVCDPTVADSCDAGPCQPFRYVPNPHAGFCGPPCVMDGEQCNMGVTTCCDGMSACINPLSGMCTPGG